MVKTYRIDCARLHDREAAHDYLAQVLELPGYYGRNLDALYDCLTELGPCVIELTGAGALRQAGGYGARMLRCLEDAARDDPAIRLAHADAPMRTLFAMDAVEGRRLDGPTVSRPSARAVIRRGGTLAMVHSLRDGYYKFPGGGIEPGESHARALIREVAEETGLAVDPGTIRPYGVVHRRDVGEEGGLFLQDNYYYFCDVLPEAGAPSQDPYEREAQFTLEWVSPAAAIAADRAAEGDPFHKNMLEREARVLELLLAEGHI